MICLFLLFRSVYSSFTSVAHHGFGQLRLSQNIFDNVNKVQNNLTSVIMAKLHNVIFYFIFYFLHIGLVATNAAKAEVAKSIVIVFYSN